MKSIFLAGGFAGFILTTLTGLVAGREFSLVLRDGAIGCLAGALLFRWFWNILVGAMRATAEEKARTAAAAAQPRPTTNP